MKIGKFQLFGFAGHPVQDMVVHDYARGEYADPAWLGTLTIQHFPGHAGHWRVHDIHSITAHFGGISYIFHLNKNYSGAT